MTNPSIFDLLFKICYFETVKKKKNVFEISLLLFKQCLNVKKLTFVTKITNTFDFSSHIFFSRIFHMISPLVES